ncbi:MAG: hypothetical protein ACKVOW_11320 [Chitinophagaceae bacterium]
MTTPIRLSFLIQATKQIPVWEFEMLHNLQHSGNVSITAFIINEEIKTTSTNWGLRLLKRFENWWFRSMPDAFKKIEVSAEFGNIPFIEIKEKEKIAELHLDIIYRSCLVTASPSLSTYSKFGEWFFVWGTGKYAGAFPIAFREVMDDCPEIGSSLLINKAGSATPFTIYDGTTTTVPYSVKNSLNSISWKSSSFLPYRVTELLKFGPDLFFTKYKANDGKDSLINTDNSKPIASLQVLFLYLRNISRYLINKLSRPFVKNRFTLLFANQKFNPTGIDLKTFISISVPPGAFWADPFIIEKDQTLYIFFEEFLYSKNKAHISLVSLSKEGNYSAPTIILDKPYHLSYPYIFELNGDFYMIPDTCANKTVQLYRCSHFPHKWEFIENLMEDTVLIDSTLLFYQEKWWLFGTRQNHPYTSTNDQLFLYYSETLFSPNWTPHPQNPVATIISNCRPAGSIFKHNGKLYRPAQNNSSKQYGYGIKINEIEILSETIYKEREVLEISPDKDNKLKAIHTINFAGNWIVIDGIPTKQ